MYIDNNNNFFKSKKFIKILFDLFIFINKRPYL